MVALHDRVYRSEFGAGAAFAEGIRLALENAVRRHWPQESAFGSVWLVERHGRLMGSLALVLKCPRAGNIDWFVLAPELRGHGLGRRLLGELLAEAEARGMERPTVHTFSLLKAAARRYREAGFRIVWERERDWYGQRIVEHVYELELAR